MKSPATECSETELECINRSQIPRKVKFSSLTMRVEYERTPVAGWKWTDVSELGIYICEVYISKLELPKHIDTPLPLPSQCQ